MIHDVKVFSPEGDLKKIIPGEQLRKKHWDGFTSNGDLSMNVERGVSRAPAKKKAKPRAQAKCFMKNCVFCGAQFSTQSPRRLICSDVCKKKRAAIYEKNRYEQMKKGTFVVTRKCGPYQKSL